MEQGPDGDEDETDDRESSARPESPGPTTGGVRIIGAETAADITSEVPVVPPAQIVKDGGSHGSVRIIDEPAEADEPPADAAHAELPHWTEPATGQVPAVLARDDDGPTDGILPPTWREEDADWVAHEEEFEPAMFSDDRASLGALDETDDTDEERRPWEFDLSSVKPGQPGPGSSWADPITEPVEVVRSGDSPDDPTRPGDTPRDEPVFTGEATVAVSAAEVAAAVSSGAPGPSAGGGSDDTLAAGEAIVPADATRPSGATRVGRARRSGLLPARLKAKPPDDIDALPEPLAAEPPGASVADVPGAGRRKTGLAGLAAADRIAEQEHATEESMASRDPGPLRPRRIRTASVPAPVGGGAPAPVE